MGRRKCRNRRRGVQRETPAPATSASSSAPPPPWIELPRDVTANILQRLGAEGMLSAQLVCSTWCKVCKDPAMWRVIDLCNPDPRARTLKRKYTAMCGRAVRRSQGQLVDLTIDSFGDGGLINYVADRSRNLKSLKLVFCIHIFGCHLVAAVEKLGQLEELHLNISLWISAHHIEAIGNACPKLKSFTFIERGSNYQLPPWLENGVVDDTSDQNRYARAIGKCMPNLHHLQLIALQMQNEGLEAILDGCPRLESLDIQHCFGLNLGGDLGKRCREQIKDLRLPNDSFGDNASWLAARLLDYDFDEDDFDQDDYCDDLDWYDDYAPLD